MSRSTWLGRRLDGAIDAFNRNPWTSRRLALLPREDSGFYDEDGLWTDHTHGFTDDPRFQRAYQRAVRATGLDYAVRWRAHTILWAAEQASKRDGAFVECGTGRGFMMSAVCEYLDWTSRPLYLFDTFKPTHVNEAGVQSADNPVSPVYATSPDAVAENFAEWPGVRLVVGEVPGTLEQQPLGEVAFLHIDMNHPLPEQAAVRHFWPRMVEGAVMVLDDYAFRVREAQRDTHDEVARELGFSILTLPTGQGLAIKTAERTAARVGA